MTVTADTVGVRRFVSGTAGWLNAAIESGQPLHIENHKRKHVTVVPTELWEEAEAALHRERAAREASMT